MVRCAPAWIMLFGLPALFLFSQHNITDVFVTADNPKTEYMTSDVANGSSLLQLPVADLVAITN